MKNSWLIEAYEPNIAYEETFSRVVGQSLGINPIDTEYLHNFCDTIYCHTSFQVDYSSANWTVSMKYVPEDLGAMSQCQLP